MGCVKALPRQAQTIFSAAVITKEGFPVNGGNKFPTGFPSDGASYCSRVICLRGMSFGCLVDNDSILNSKNWKSHRRGGSYLLGF